MNYPSEYLNYLKIFYQKVDAYSSHLSAIHIDRLQCKKGCSSCCVDDLEVLGLEAAFIQQNSSEVLKENASTKGKCSFLDSEGACRVYESRPFICRTHGLPLSFEITENGESREVLDICELNETETPLDQIPSNQIFHIKQFEEILIGLQLDLDQGKMHRVKLRSLFD